MSNYPFPTIYRRQLPVNTVKQKLSLIGEVKTGQIIDFVYGIKQVPGQVGGWKNDNRPTLLVFHDDKKKYIEGINVNYLSRYYLYKLRKITSRFPGIRIDGRIFYYVIKRTAKYAVKKGYRKYMRSSLRSTYLHVYKEPKNDK